MPVGVAGEHVENLPFEQVLGVNGWVGRSILKEVVAPTEGWTSVLLIFVLMPITQCLAKVLLVQSMYLAGIILILPGFGCSSSRQNTQRTGTIATYGPKQVEIRVGNFQVAYDSLT